MGVVGGRKSCLGWAWTGSKKEREKLWMVPDIDWVSPQVRSDSEARIQIQLKESLGGPPPIPFHPSPLTGAGRPIATGRGKSRALG